MSRFIDEDEAEIVSHDLTEKIKEINKENVSKKQGTDNTDNPDNNNKDDAKNNEKKNREDNLRKRKSLQTQLANNRLYKYRERKRKMEKQNSSYKIRKDSREFYTQLKSEKESKKAAEKAQYEDELSKFRAQQLELLKEDAEEEEVDTEPISQEVNTKSLVSYSDSDSD